MGVVRDGHRWVPISLLRPCPRSGTLDGFGLKQSPQAPARALGDLAVLLEGPPKPLAELGTVHPEGDLAGEHEPLVVGEPGRELPHTPQLQPVRHERVNVGPRVGELEFVLAGAAQREGTLERGLHRAATAERPAAVVDAREKALLERVLDVGTAGEPLAAPRSGQELEHGLAQAVLQVLGPQPVAVGPQQPCVLGARHEGHLLGGVVGVEQASAAERPGSPGRRLGRVSGRHTGMSYPAAHRPPSQSWVVGGDGR
jgi:hypothetical protein